MQSSILIAMSGGVDSSVAALLELKRYSEVRGLTLRLSPETQSVPLGELQSEIDAKAICDSLAIPHTVADFRTEFADVVIRGFIDAYESGETPNPCVICNRKVKFCSMLAEADKLGMDKIATGHYAKVGFDEDSGRWFLRKGADASKDQSYMLYNLTQEQLARVEFPLGDMLKTEIRAIAAKSGFVSAEKKDSQDICFIPDGDYVRFIEEWTKKSYPCGNFIDRDGNVIGAHKGIIRYTTGQRKGLGLSLPAPMYVLEKDTEKNTVLLGTDDDLYSGECRVTDINYVSVAGIFSPVHADVKVRYSHHAAPATLIPCDGGITVRFDKPVRAITRGQAAVFYDGDTVLGGGKIV